MHRQYVCAAISVQTMITTCTRVLSKNLHFSLYNCPILYLFSIGTLPTKAPPIHHLCRSWDRISTTGHLQDLPPRTPLWKAIKFQKEIREIGDILDVGKQTQDGEAALPYSSVEEAAKEHPRIDAICKLMNVNTYKTAWRLVQQVIPDFVKKNIRMVGQRDPVQAKDAAQQLSGQKPMEFPHVTNDPVLKHHPLMERFIKKGEEAGQAGIQFFYQVTQLVKNIFLDAAKIEPLKWAQQRKACVRKTAQSHVTVSHVLQKLNVRGLIDILSMLCAFLQSFAPVFSMHACVACSVRQGPRASVLCLRQR